MSTYVPEIAGLISLGGEIIVRVQSLRALWLQ